MANLRWLFAIPVALATMLAAARADASAIRDGAGMFSKEVVAKAKAELDRLERTTHVPVVIETMDSIAGLDSDATAADKKKAIDALAIHRDQAIDAAGVYVLISKREHLISHVLVRERYADLLSIDKRDAIREAFIDDFKKKNFDGGLKRAVETIERSLEGGAVRNKAARVPAPFPHRAVAARGAGGGSTMGTFLLIVAGIFGVLLVLRLLGGLFGRSAGPGMPGAGMGMGRPGMGGGPGYYGGPGYGGGGGGFMSGLFGGLGGALAGNWLYDQFSGRHGHMGSADVAGPADSSAGYTDAGGDAIVGADDDPGGGASWDDGGGADVGGGDWGGGDAGGGDWGGGGGDWGGGGGGGDW